MKVLEQKLLATPGAEIIVSKAALSFKALFSDIEHGLRERNLVVRGKKTRAIPKQYGQISKFKNVKIFIWNGVPSEEIEFKDTK